MPFVISGGGGQDDLMRRSKLNFAEHSGPLCSNCMRAAQSMHASVTSARPSPWPDRVIDVNDGNAVEADPRFEKSFETVQRIASFLGDKNDQEDIERLKIQLRQRGADGQAGNPFGKAMRSCLWMIFLIFSFFIVIGWLAN